MNASNLTFFHFVLLHIVWSRGVPTERPSHVLKSRDVNLMEMIEKSNSPLRLSVERAQEKKKQENYNMKRGKHWRIQEGA